MKIPARAAPFALAAVALALTVTGVVIAATDPNPGGVVKDPLALNGYPPKSAQVRVVISSGPAFSVTGDVNMNFTTNAIEAQFQIPMLLSATGVDVRLVNGRLYAGTTDLSNVVGRSWLGAVMKQPSLFGLSLEMTKPDIAFIAGFGNDVVTKSGYTTTYHFHRDNVRLTSPSKTPVALPPLGSVDLRITTGQQGEVSAASVSFTSTSTSFSAAMTVVSYNAPAHIVAPPASQVKDVTSFDLKKIFGSSPILGLLSPGSITAFGQIRLN